MAKQHDWEILRQHKIPDEGCLMMHLICKTEDLHSSIVVCEIVVEADLSWLSSEEAPCLS